MTNTDRREASEYDAVANRSAAVVIWSYSTSFGWACRLLPAPQREHICNIYALVRVADEIVDDPRPDWDTPERSRLLAALEAETYQAMSSNHSPNLVVHAFARTCWQNGISADLVEPFFASMRTDLMLQDHDEASLAEYIHGSAEVVGLMCLRVFIADDEAAYQRLAPGAARLGAAFQKINFLRDIDHDHASLGRMYFPGLDPATFTDGHRDELLDDIDADLHAAGLALTELPTGSRRAVRAAHSLFSELSRRLRSTPATRICEQRIRVPDAVKAQILARSVLSRGTR